VLYEPKRATKRAVIWLHGAGGASVFESRRTNLLAEVFVGRGVGFFPFNNRGSGIVRRAGNDLGGAAFERIRDCVADIDGAIRELWRRGYRDITLAGHSTGANKIAVYDHYKPRNRARRYVLIAGGDDTGLLYKQLGARRFHALLTKAKRMLRSDELAPVAAAEDDHITTLSPAVRRAVLEYHVDPTSIRGSGKDGRLTKDDVKLIESQLRRYRRRLTYWVERQLELEEIAIEAYFPADARTALALRGGAGGGDAE